MFLILGFQLLSSDVAVIGVSLQDKNAVDVLLAEYQSEILFLERQNYSAIYSEQELNRKFGAAHMAKKFHQVKVFGVLENSRFTTFETSYGFRLSQRKFSSGNIQEIAAGMAADLRKALEFSGNIEKKRMVSIASVRNNLHCNYSSRAKKISAEIQQRASSLDAIILERDYLMELLLEKELTEAWAKAVAASEIIHFELNPGAETDTIEYGVYSMDAAEKIRFQASCTTLSEVFDKLQEYLKVQNIAAPCTLRQEAARFYREAQISITNRDFTGAVQKSFAALALDPEKPEYFCFYRISEKMHLLYPWYKGMMMQVLKHPELLNDWELKYKFVYCVDAIRKYYYTLSSEDKSSFDALTARAREVVFRPGAADRFIDMKPGYFPDDAAYIKAKMAQFDVILEQVVNGSMQGEKLLEISGSLIGFRRLILPSRREKWDETILNKLSLLNDPHVEVLAEILRCNAFLYSRNCTLEAASEHYRKLWELAHSRKVRMGNFDYIDYYAVAAWINLHAEIRKYEKEYRNK